MHGPAEIALVVRREADLICPKIAGEVAETRLPGVQLASSALQVHSPPDGMEVCRCPSFRPAGLLQNWLSLRSGGCRWPT